MIEQLLAEELSELRVHNLYRSLRTIEHIEGAYAYLQGKRTLLFCGNDYLGLSQHPRMIQAVQKAAKTYGVGAGASRLVSGNWRAHLHAEERLAALKHQEKTLLFSSGYLANVGVLSALAGEKDLIVMDKLCHASLIDGARLSGATLRVFPHKNYARCRELLKNAKDYPRKILISDTVFSMDGDLADFSELIAMRQQFDAILVLDDAHGTGVLGMHGGGALEDVHLENQVDVIIGTTSKALGCVGGFAACSSVIADYLLNASRSFIYSTGIPPMIAAAISEAVSILETEPEIRQKLWKNIQTVHQMLSQMGYAEGPITSPIFPIILGEESVALEASAQLLEQGFLIPAIRTPTVAKGKARLRLTVSAMHTSEELEKLKQVFQRILKPKKISPTH